MAGSAIAIALFVGSALPASALTVDDIQSQIKDLLAQVSALSKQLSDLRGTQQGGDVPTGDTLNVQLPPNPSRFCPIIARNLALGARGDDVRDLQEFLRDQGLLSAASTGFFGALTVNALQRWQASQGIAKGGDERTTGWGLLGPTTRARIQAWCGNRESSATTTPRVMCTQEYAPVCGTKPIVCITTPCNPVPTTYGNRCMMRADNATLLSEGRCGNPTGGENKAPVISGFSGPTTLTLNETGTWKIQASDPENGQLTYSIRWGDEWYPGTGAMQSSAERSIVQDTSFTHSYATAGTYTVIVLVTDGAGKQAKASATVAVGKNLVACTEEYAPVCAQPPEPACRHSLPACMMATPGPQTYGNRCLMNVAGATLLYTGQCKRDEPVACTMDAMQCSNGSWVGRTGPNCQFVCPASGVRSTSS